MYYSRLSNDASQRDFFAGCQEFNITTASPTTAPAGGYPTGYYVVLITIPVAGVLLLVIILILSGIICPRYCASRKQRLQGMKAQSYLLCLYDHVEIYRTNTEKFADYD